MTTNTTNQINDLITTIAKKHLALQTLETYNNGNLDFKEFGVANIRAALQAAYDAGFLASKN